jgi:DNA-binding GntR family transcriptional regulator
MAAGGGKRLPSLGRIQVRSFSPVREEVFNRLRQAILTGELQPGTRLVERELASQLGVSRTPVREAFRKLELEGLVAQNGRRTLVVTHFSHRDVQEIFQIRAALEGLAAEMASRNAQPRHLVRFAHLLEEMRRAVASRDMRALGRLNDRFNEVLYDAAGSQRLSQLLGTLRESVSRFTRMSYDVPGRGVEAMAEHEAIVAAIRARDPEAARRAAVEHVRRSERTFFQSAQSRDGAVGAGR